MAEFEIYSLIIRGSSALIIGIALLFTGYQIMLQRKAHNENHKWNRMIAAQKVLETDNLTSDTIELNKKLNILNTKYAIPIDKVKNLIKSDSTYQNKIHKLLNIYESYAIGIKLGIYDEEVIKLARKGTILRTFEAFKPYIEERRTTVGGQKAYIQLERICKKWGAEDKTFESKIQTGEI